MKLRIPIIAQKKERSPTSVTSRQIARKFIKSYKQKVKQERRSMHPDLSAYPQENIKTVFRDRVPDMPSPEIGQREKEDEILGKKLGKMESIRGIEIPTKSMMIAGSALKLDDDSSKAEIRICYSLIPRQPKREEKVYAYADIKWNDRTGGLVYFVAEPKLTDPDRKMIEEIKRELEERLDVNFIKIGEVRARSILREEIDAVLSTLRVPVDQSRRDNLMYYIERDIIGLGKIEPLMRDSEIEDISCDGVGVPIYVYHKSPNVGPVKTNIFFETDDELNSFVVKIAQKCRKTISISEPLLDASLPDGSRIQATLGTDIARRGSNFTIRKFTETPITPTIMVSENTMSSMQMAYMWLAIENGQSVLISGGTATGKTSLLNALSLFIRPNLKIVSIEDTPELRIPHPHWVPEVARTPIGEGGKGEVTLFDLLRSSLRQRPDYIIMGEVRGKEAFVLFQQMATGHPSLATIHAASVDQLADRLTTPPISLPPSLMQNLDIIVFLLMTRKNDKYVRRANTILEIIGIDEKVPLTNTVFKWDTYDDKFSVVQKSAVLEKIARKLGVTDKSIQEELFRRKGVIDWMVRRGIFDYREVANVISTYYSSPEKITDMVMEEV